MLPTQADSGSSGCKLLVTVRFSSHCVWPGSILSLRRGELFRARASDMLGLIYCTHTRVPDLESWKESRFLSPEGLLSRKAVILAQILTILRLGIASCWIVAEGHKVKCSACVLQMAMAACFHSFLLLSCGLHSCRNKHEAKENCNHNILLSSCLPMVLTPQGPYVFIVKSYKTGLLVAYLTLSTSHFFNK